LAELVELSQNIGMTPKLTPEQRDALNHSDGPVAVEDDENHRVYFLVDEPTFTNLQQQEDLTAIREGIADMEAGQVASLDDVIARIRTKLGLPHSG
jgi:hypothetical protein